MMPRALAHRIRPLLQSCNTAVGIDLDRIPGGITTPRRSRLPNIRCRWRMSLLTIPWRPTLLANASE